MRRTIYQPEPVQRAPRPTLDAPIGTAGAVPIGLGPGPSSMMNEQRRPTTTGEAIWTLREQTLLAMLRRCHAGESPDEVYMETYVNLFDHRD